MTFSNPVNLVICFQGNSHISKLICVSKLCFEVHHQLSDTREHRRFYHSVRDGVRGRTRTEKGRIRTCTSAVVRLSTSLY